MIIYLFLIFFIDCFCYRMVFDQKCYIFSQLHRFLHLLIIQLNGGMST